MRVVGQFNLGFIIALLRCDLFIIDQHAADEKHRYELLRRQRAVQQQPLITPLPLQLSPAQAALMLDHLPVFTANGFSFTPPSSPPLCLSAIPYAHDRQFGVQDVHELLELLAEGGGGRGGGAGGDGGVLLPQLLQVYASRACRSAVMIGDALDSGGMRRIVGNMAEMEQPWSCPHGRPTMRHLFDLRMLSGLSARDSHAAA